MHDKTDSEKIKEDNIKKNLELAGDDVIAGIFDESFDGDSGETIDNIESILPTVINHEILSSPEQVLDSNSAVTPVWSVELYKTQGSPLCRGCTTSKIKRNDICIRCHLLQVHPAEP